MLKKRIGWSVAIIAGIISVMAIFSCEQESIDEMVSENFTDQDSLNADSTWCHRGFGRLGPAFIGRCFTLVFPVTVSYPDSSETTYDDIQSLKEDLRAYRESNPDAEEWPELVYPVEVLFRRDSTVQEVASQEELFALKDSCQAQFPGKGRRHGKKRGRG